MKRTIDDIIKSPNSKQLTIITSIWLFGFILLILATTDLFREDLFQSKNLITNILLIKSTAAVLHVHYKYWKRLNKAEN